MPSQAADADALATAYLLHWRILYHAAYCVLHEREDAEDCVHDVLLDVWARKSRYRPERGSLRTFLVACVRNAALTRRRSTERHRELERIACGRQPEVEIVDFTTMFQLRSALSTLPPKQLRTLTLAFFGQRTHAEIARELDLPLGTVKSRLALAMRKLNTHMRY
jgi:RNA polymerase sigma-70 factor, ECF subfamily